jgi:hypothetical protein
MLFMRLTFSIVRSAPARERTYALPDGHGLAVCCLLETARQLPISDSVRARIEDADEGILLGLIKN